MNAHQKIFWFIATIASIYAITAAIGSFLADNSKGGCERANISRGELYRGAQSDIQTADAITAAGVKGEMVAAMEDTRARAERSRARLTFSPGTDEPWKVDCDAAYPDPLPWP